MYYYFQSWLYSVYNQKDCSENLPDKVSSFSLSWTKIRTTSSQTSINLSTNTYGMFIFSSPTREFLQT